jgi:iron-sulfur cluster repair di-iron protein
MTPTCESFTAAPDHPDWAEAPLCQLIEHIVHRHHSWLRQEMTLIEQMIDRVTEARGVKRFDSILPLRHVFSEFQYETLDHLRIEEEWLFPAIARLENGLAGSGGAFPMLEHNHDAAARRLDEIRDLTHGYDLPETACDTLRTLYEELETLEADMRAHLRLENDFLFPRAARLARENADARSRESTMCLAAVAANPDCKFHWRAKWTPLGQVAQRSHPTLGQHASGGLHSDEKMAVASLRGGN